MIDLFLEIFHILVGLLIVAFCIWVIIQVHNYFSKDNISFDDLIKTMKQS